MGLDILDLVFRLERAFGIRISREHLDRLLDKNDPPDILVGDLFDFIRGSMSRSQVFDPEVDADALWPTLQRAISDSLGVDVDEVAKDRWLIHDLGLG